VWTVSREAKDPKDAIVAEGVYLLHSVLSHMRLCNDRVLTARMNVAAEARQIDLIVMGRRGLGPLQQYA
jgi:hypothetical protein